MPIAYVCRLDVRALGGGGCVREDVVCRFASFVCLGAWPFERLLALLI